MKRIIISILYVLPIISFGQVSATLKITNASAGFQKLTVPTVGLIMNGSNGYNADTTNLLVSKQRGDSLAMAITANSTIYNVIKFGAVGDGVTDCTPFINNAIDSASAHGGGIVDIPEGTYIIKAAYVTTDTYKPTGIILQSNVVLQGHGFGTILKLSAPPGTSTFSGSQPTFTTNSVFSDIIRGYRVYNTIVRDLSIDGNLANQINTTLNAYTNPQGIDSLHETSGISFYLGSNNKINNVNNASSAGYGFQFANCPYSVVSNSLSYNAVNGGVQFLGTSNFGVASNNIISKSYSDGFRIQSSDITVVGNNVSWTRQNSNHALANYAGIYLESADRCRILNNTSSNNSSFGIDMNANGHSSYGILVSGNTLMTNRSAGMLMAINHSLITGNYIYDNGADSLGVEDTLPVGNYSIGGILVAQSDSFSTISNNTFLPGRGFQKYAFDNQGIYINYTGNMIYNQSTYLYGNDWTKNTASNNISFNGTTTSYSNTGGIAGSPGDIISFTTPNVPSAITAVASGYYLASQGSGTKPAWLVTPITAQTTLVAGTKAISIAGVTTSSKATVSFVSIGGTVSTTWQYAIVCTSGTVTITALTNAGTTDTSDTSTLTYTVTP